MTHTFKVGDKGRTDCPRRPQWEYEITYASDILVAKMFTEEGYVGELTYDPCGQSRTSSEKLIPPERRIQGTLYFREGSSGVLTMFVPANSKIRHYDDATLAVIPIDVPVGTGMGGDDE